MTSSVCMFYSHHQDVEEVRGAAEGLYNTAGLLLQEIPEVGESTRGIAGILRLRRI